MTLPTPDQLNELRKLIAEIDGDNNNASYSYSAINKALEKALGPGKWLSEQAAKKGVTYGAAALHVGTGIAVAPVGALLAPWIGAADVARRAGGIFELHDLKEHAAAKGDSDVHYYCLCGGCHQNISYVIDKKERNVGRIAIGVATLGVSVAVNTVHSIYKSRQSGRPKERVSKGLVASARKGCTVAMATIFLLAGDWEFLRGGNARTMARAISIIMSDDGWKELKREW